MPEALDQHHCDRGKGEAGRDDEGHRDRRSRHVLEDKVACRRLGLIDQACEHVAPYDFQIAPRTKPTAAAIASVAIG